jgi:hypothetical protein
MKVSSARGAGHEANGCRLLLQSLERSGAARAVRSSCMVLLIETHGMGVVAYVETAAEPAFRCKSLIVVVVQPVVL